MAVWFIQRHGSRWNRIADRRWHLAAENEGQLVFACQPLIPIKIRRSWFTLNPFVQQYPKCRRCLLAARKIKTLDS